MFLQLSILILFIRFFDWTLELFDGLWNCSTDFGTVRRTLELFDGLWNCSIGLWNCSTDFGTVRLDFGTVRRTLELFDGVIFCIFHLYLSSKYTRFISIESLTFVQNKFYIIPKMQM